MPRTILTTVGTSLLGNAGRAMPGREPTDRDLAEFLARTGPVRASAESNALSRLLRDGDRIVLLFSHTEEGRRCAEALARHYRARDHDATLAEVRDLSYAEGRFKLRGLRSLVSTMADWIGREQRRGVEVLINATGGFKAEIAYATLVGQLFDVPVYYVHERFDDLIEMPPVPVAWDYGVLAECDEFFDWIDEEPRTADAVERRVLTLPQQFRPQVRLLLSEEPDGHTYLSPAGEAFLSAFRFAVERAATVPIYLSDAARRRYDGAEAEVRAVWERTLQKLRSPELRRGGSDRAGEGDCLVFPKGHRRERVFWFERDGAVYVCEVARHTDESYERLLARGVHRRDYPPARFHEWAPSS